MRKTDGPGLSPLARGTLIGLLLAITGAIVYGHFHELFYFAGISRVMSTLWGRLVLFDFGLSLLILGAWVCVLESDKRKGLALAVGFLVLGCPVVLAYLLVRSRRVRSVEELFLRQLDGQQLT
jgi:hypothetical protein